MYVSRTVVRTGSSLRTIAYLTALLSHSIGVSLVTISEEIENVTFLKI